MMRRSGLSWPTRTCTGHYPETPHQHWKENSMHALLLSLTWEGAFTALLYNQLRSSAGKVPLLYRLPKIRKPEVPLWPIVSFLNSPTYELSKHLVSILSPLVGKTTSHVKNSAEFASFIAGQTVGSKMILVSFDVVSLSQKFRLILQ